jgi:PAS domain S-box-containing protein
MQNQTKTKQELNDEIAAYSANRGEMSEAIRNFNWSSTPLGPIETWSQSLRTAVSILINSRYPMVICWGPQLIKLYNDAYRPLLGAMKHPGALGRPMQEVWPELWPIIGPMLHGVMETGEPTFFEDMQLFVDRNGYLEEMFATFSYSPIWDESNEVGGIFAACTETTQTVIGQRRLKTLRNLAARSSDAKTIEDACHLIIETLATNLIDIPFALLYLLDASQQQAQLIVTSGCEPGTRASPRIVDMRAPEIWPFSEVVRTGQSKLVDDLIHRLDCPPKSPWSDPTHTALVLPIAQPGQTQPTGLLVVGVSPRCALDEDYQTFFELMAGQIASAIANARAYEEERQRAEAYIQFQANVLSQVNDAVIAIDNEHRITYWNKGAERLYQLTPDQAIGQQLEEITRYRWLKPEDEQAASAALATTGSWQGENIHVKRSGEEIYVESSVSVLKDERGATTGLLAVIRDISEAHRQAEQRQRAEEVLRRYERIVSATPDGMALLDRNYVYQVVNQTYLDWNLKRYDDIVGHSINELLDEDVVQTVVKPLLDRCLAGELIRYEAWFNYADGSKRFVGISYSPYVELNGTISGVVVTARDLTELKRAEAALSQSQETVQRHLAEIETIYATAPVGLCLVDLNLRFVRLNDRLAEINGLPVTAHIGRTIREVLPELADDMERTYLQVIQSGLPILDVEVHGTTPAQPGIERDWSLSYYPLKDSDDRILGVNVMVQDITQRKHSEAALRESEERFRQLAENIDAVFWMTSRDRYQIIYISPAFDRIWGRSRTDFYENGYLLLDSIHPADVERVTTALQTPVNDYEIEYRILRPDGAIRWIRDRSFPIRNEQGDIYRYAGIAEDITNRKQTEQKIREQAALLDVATNAILVRDLEHHILFWNNSAQRLYGWQASEVLGKNVNELLYRVGKAALPLAPIQKTLAEKGQWQGELHQVTRDGKDIIVESLWTLVRDEDGQPKTILVVNTDITDKKQLEAQFLRAQRLESIGTLASGIAHDLNNILSPILISAQLLQTKNFDTRSQKLLKTIETNAKRGAAVIKQVLSFARGVEGERKIVQIRHLILEIKQIVKETFPKSIELYTDIAPDLWAVSGDATQVHQVLLNLCVNARDAMPDGGTLSIYGKNFLIDQNYARMNLDAQVGPYIVITVADTGIGIPPEVMDRIFEPFFTTKQQGKGTGLGLSTVIGIIKSHGGFVKVSSDVGKGTQFQVFLPAVQEAEMGQVEVLELPRGHGELILVVEDEASVNEITITSLETYNYRAIAAHDGIEAIALYAQHQTEISVVLIDMMMPSLDGSTTIRILQAMNPQVEIIAISGLVSNAQVASAVGVKAFLLKPFTARELLNAIQGVLTTP